jgi:hypothetical protein
VVVRVTAAQVRACMTDVASELLLVEQESRLSRRPERAPADYCWGPSQDGQKLPWCSNGHNVFVMVLGNLQVHCARHLVVPHM